MPTTLDIIAVTFIAIAVPLYSLWERRKNKDLHPDSDTDLLPTSYWRTIIMLWAMVAGVLGIWALEGRGVETLGLTATHTDFGIWVWLAVGLMATLLVFQSYKAGTDEKVASTLMASLESEEGVNDVMPRRENEYRLFNWVSITAGITEEILYRGFLIWFFAAWMPIWGAAAASIVVFTLAHLYQNSVTALTKVAGMAVVLTAVYLVSGSLWPAILLHAVVDLTSNAMFWRARNFAAA